MTHITQSHNPLGSMRAPPLKLVAGALIVCVLGLPINDLASYACLAAATLILCIGNITTSRRRLAAAAAVAIVASAVKFLVAPPLLDNASGPAGVPPSKTRRAKPVSGAGSDPTGEVMMAQLAAACLYRTSKLRRGVLPDEHAQAVRYLVTLLGKKSSPKRQSFPAQMIQRDGIVVLARSACLFPAYRPNLPRP